MLMLLLMLMLMMTMIMVVSLISKALQDKVKTAFRAAFELYG